MKTRDFFSGTTVPGIVAIMMIGVVTLQGAENQPAAEPAADVVPEAGQPAPVDPDSAYGELVHLVRAGVDEGILLSFAQNSVRFFELDADRIIYLTDLGVPSAVIEAAMERDTQLFEDGISSAVDTADTEQTAAAVNDAPPEVTEEYLYDALSPYGTWVYIEGYGRCWQPAVVTYHAGWRPYCDNGRWVYTDCGWYWMSDYSWGWAAFHYGRWFRHYRYGWCWWPDTVWAPSWVSWRYDRAYCGWAPLPPYTTCRPGSGIYYRGRRVHFSYSFGLGYECYVFVSTRYLCEPEPKDHCLDQKDTERMYDRTRAFTRIDYDARKQRLVNNGISPDIVSVLSGETIEPVSVSHTRGPRGNNGRREQLNADTRTLVVARPDPAVLSRGSRSAADMRTGTPQNQRSSQRNYVSAAGPGTPRQPSGQAVRTNPSGSRPAAPASQAEQRQNTTQAAAARPPQYVPGSQASLQRGDTGSSVSGGNRSAGTAAARGQGNSTYVKPQAPPPGKADNPGRGNSASAQGRSAVGQGEQKSKR